MSSFKPAYLLHGDDHGRLAERRGGLRALAERESGTGGVEVFEGDAATPEQVALALSAMTFAMGRRFVIVDGAERFKDRDVEAHLVPALAGIAPETTVAFFAREEGRVKASPKLAAAVKAAGGEVVVESAMTSRELPRWLVGEAGRLGITLEGAAAQALVAAVGDRRQRLLRELEKLALEHGAGATVGVEEVQAAAAPSAERQVWGLVDALVARDRRAVTRSYLALRAQGEALPRLVPLMARRLRDVLAVAARMDAGETPQAIKGSLKMSSWAADRRIKEARGADADVLRRALEELSALELAGRGLADVEEETAAIRALGRIAS